MRLVTSLVLVTVGCAEPDPLNIDCNGLPAEVHTTDVTLDEVREIAASITYALNIEMGARRTVKLHMDWGGTTAISAPLCAADMWICPRIESFESELAGVAGTTPGWGWRSAGPGGDGCALLETTFELPSDLFVDDATITLRDYASEIEIPLGNALAQRTLEVLTSPVRASQPITVRWTPATDFDVLPSTIVHIRAGSTSTNIAGATRAEDTITFSLPDLVGEAQLLVSLSEYSANHVISETVAQTITIEP